MKILYKLSRSLFLLFVFLVGCGLTKDLKDTRALGKPYYKKLNEMFEVGI